MGPLWVPSSCTGKGSNESAVFLQERQEYKDRGSYISKFKNGGADGIGEEREIGGTSQRGVWGNGGMPEGK